MLRDKIEKKEIKKDKKEIKKLRTQIG